MERMQKKREKAQSSSFFKKKSEEKLDLFEGIKERGTSSPKCASIGANMGSLLDQSKFK